MMELELNYDPSVWLERAAKHYRLRASHLQAWEDGDQRVMINYQRAAHEAQAAIAAASIANAMYAKRRAVQGG